MTITRARLAETLQKEQGLGKGQAKDFIASVFERIRECLESGEDVLISGFGKFCVMEKRSRRGRNPQTNEDLILGARRVVTFKCSTVLKEKLNGKG